MSWHFQNADEVKQLDGTWISSHSRCSSWRFCSIFLNLPTEIMDSWISKCPADFLRTNIGKWERFFRKIKAIFHVLKQTSLVELSITLAPIRSDIAHAQSFFSLVTSGSCFCKSAQVSCEKHKVGINQVCIGQISTLSGTESDPN